MIPTQTLTQPKLTAGDGLLHVQSIINMRDDHPLFDEIINTSFRPDYCVVNATEERVQFSCPHFDDIISLPSTKIGTLSLDYSLSDITISGYIHESTEQSLVHDKIKDMVQAYIEETLAYMESRKEKLSTISAHIR